MPAILELIAEGRLNPAAVITARANWVDAADALLEAPIKLTICRES